MILDSNELNIIYLQEGQGTLDEETGTYIWVRYSTFENHTDITDDPTGAVYIGVAYDKDTAEESEDPADYVWSKIAPDEVSPDGASYIVILDNEDMSFLSTTDGLMAKNEAFNCNVKVFRDMEEITDFTIRYADIVVPPGMTLTINNTAKRLTLSTKKGKQITSYSGTIKIPVVIGDLTFIKELRYTFVKDSDGSESYDWIVYSDNARPLASEMTLDPTGAKYVGVAPNKDTEEYSTNFQDYEWFPLNNIGDSVVSIQPIYFKSVYDTAENIPAPSNEALALVLQEEGLTVDKGTIAVGIPSWMDEKPKYTSGFHLWIAYRVKLSDGTYVFTTPQLSQEWEGNSLIIGSA